MNRTEFTTEQKFQILLLVAEERYKSIHIMRERVHKISVWIVGIFLVLMSWVIKEGASFSITQSGILSVAILATLASVLVYIRDIKNGFENSFQTLSKIERLLGLYEKGFFSNLSDSLYPEKWARVTGRRGNFFKNTCLLIIVGASIVLIGVWLIRLSP